MRAVEPKYCTKCGHVGAPAWKEEPRRISWSLAIVLLLLFVIPGMFYLLFGGTIIEYPICVACHARHTLIPMGSPVAQAAISKFNEPKSS